MTTENHTNALPACYGIIPARWQSSRFPGKALAEILGKPMICHVYERAVQCARLTSVVLATDDARIQAAARQWHIPVVMTRADHPSGTDRVLEAARILQLPADAVVVNIQGDEPALESDMLSQLLAPFAAARIQVTTLARKISAKEAQNPDRVKVVLADDGQALYFSRAPIPHALDGHRADYYGHIGIYAFRMEALVQFVSLGRGRLETAEKLEQLRLLENNIPVHVVKTEHQSIGVDRPADLQIVSDIMMKKNSVRK